MNRLSIMQQIKFCSLKGTDKQWIGSEEMMNKVPQASSNL